MVNITLEHLECPVCFETFKPPVHICVNGHDLCDTCKQQVEECPTCRGFFIGTRNITVERLLEQIEQDKRRAPSRPLTAPPRPPPPVPVIVPQSNTTGILCCFSHLKECRYQQSAVPFDRYIDHLETDHRVFTVAAISGTFTRRNYLRGQGNIIRNGPSRMFTMHFQNRSFVIQYLQEETEISIWITLHGSEYERTAFRGLLSVSGKSDGLQHVPKLEWSGPIRHLTTDEPSYVLRCSRHILKIPVTDFWKYLHVGNNGLKTWFVKTLLVVRNRENEIGRQNGPNIQSVLRLPDVPLQQPIPQSRTVVESQEQTSMTRPSAYLRGDTVEANSSSTRNRRRRHCVVV